ncbi:MAG: hypothetical protein CMN28_08515 [Salinisphaeraceae bacterium]|nr:hypothetical protein [Salinisphaeraceae bacterium]
MDKKSDYKPLSIALGTAFAATVTFAGMASAGNSNPFQAEEISGTSSTVILAEGKCGEGKCGGEKGGEGSCGGDKGGEGSCGGDKGGEGSCGGDKG